MRPGGPERRLAAILFTDLVDSTALMARDESAALRAKARHRELVRACVEQHGGRFVESPGDETLSIFGSALDAVNAALAIEAAVRGEAFRLHVAIHSGDVLIDGDEIHGDGVNIAARLLPLSEGGGICVSQEVYQTVRNQPDLAATSLGARDLRNVGRPVEVLRLSRSAPGVAARRPPRPQPASSPWRGAAIAAVVLIAAAGWWWLGRGAPGAGDGSRIRSVAVLPLENLSGDPEQDFFVDGVTDSLIADLARVSALRVTSRTSVMQYKGTRSSLPEIAAALGVDALVEGTVNREGDRVRVTAQLIDARTDSHLWAGRFDRELEGILALQSEIAALIARQVNARLEPEEERRFTTRPPANRAAHDEYLKGLYFAQKHTPAASLRARDHFNAGMRIDPEYPLPYAGLADTLSCSPLHTWAVPAEGADAMPRAVMDQALALAERAIELDEGLAEAQVALGLVELFRNLDWDSAEERFERSLAVNASYEFANRAYALLLAHQRRFDEAIVKIERARELDPFSPFVASLAGDVYWYADDTERAQELWRESTQLDAAHPLGYQGMAVALCRQGRVEEAVAHFEQALRYSENDPLAVSDLAHCHAISGQTEQARALLRELEGRASHAWVSSIGLGLIHLGLGEHDAALAQLEQAYEQRDFRLTEIAVDRRWDPVREDPRFRAIVRKIGLPV